MISFAHAAPTRTESQRMLKGVEVKQLVTHLKIPPGVAHGCRALEHTHLLYIAPHLYNPGDEGRIPPDDPSIGCDGTSFPPIS